MANNTRQRRFLRMEEMKKILILFTYQDWDEVSRILQDLQSKRKEVLLWTVQSKKEAEGSITLPFNVRVINHKEVSMLFGLSSSVVDEFKNTECDALFDLTTKEDNSLLSLLANNTAGFCIGVKEMDYKIYDFTILKEEDKTLFETYDQIKNYLNNIR